MPGCRAPLGLPIHAPSAGLLALLLAAHSTGCAGEAGGRVPYSDLPDEAADARAGEALADLPRSDASPPCDTAAEAVADMAVDGQISPHEGPWQGLLQWHVQHNLDTSDCMPFLCNLTAEDKETMPQWLALARQYSDLAVLHWDDPIPYLAFIESAPDGEDPVAFYDERLDPALRMWLDAFAEHFQQMPRRYLAVSLLSGVRDRYQPQRLDDKQSVPLGDACPAFDPGTSVTITVPEGPYAGTHALEPGAAYLRFLLYLRAKLTPDYMGLLVEVNLLRQACPDRWPGMVALYHDLYDAVRAQVGPALPLFATLAYHPILAWNEKACFELEFSSCGTPAVADYPAPAAEACYPLDLTDIQDLDQGNRLDILALSAYFDSLMMAPPQAPNPVMEINLADWDGASDCWMHSPYGPFVDPMAQLDRLGWTKPVAMAEWSARSCQSLVRIEAEGQSYWVEPDASPETQLAWLNLVLETARQHNFTFVIWSFLQDYSPLPKWVVDQGVIDPWFHGVINTWACSGLLTSDDQPKPAVLDAWMEGLPPSP